MKRIWECGCTHSVELICAATPEMDVGTTIWRHGEGEAAMVVRLMSDLLFVAVGFTAWCVALLLAALTERMWNG